MNRLLCIFLVLFACAANTAIYAQAGKRLSAEVAKAHAAGTQFESCNLFTTAANQQGYDAFTGQVLLRPIKQAISSLYQRRPLAVSMQFKAASGKIYQLELMTAHPTSDAPDIGYIDHSGRHRTTTVETGLHYQGAIAGMPGSIAAMSVFANGDVAILFSNKDGNFNLGKVDDGSGNYILFNGKDRKQQVPFNCFTKDETAPLPRNAAEKTTGVVLCRKVRIYWEGSYSYYQGKGSLVSAQNYAYALFNVMQAIFLNDNMAVELSSLYIWTAPDYYNDQTLFIRLGHFYGYWYAQDHSFNGDVAMLLAMNTGFMGLAYIDNLCDKARYAATVLMGSFMPFPTYDWDTYAVTHETGHSIGSPHSHSCAWNTGPGGTCGSIDDCAVQDPGINCFTCPSLDSISKTGWDGTIMSYCGLRINLAAGFGKVAGDFLRNRINIRSCLKSILAPELLTSDICNNDGAVMVHYLSNNFGVAPYKYSWSTGATTQGITGISIPATYTVHITDSNNCTAQLSADIRKFPKPGDGQPVPHNMPLCCRDTSYNVMLQANLPVDINLCRTVSWLRTTAPVTSYQDLLTAYAAAGNGDLLPSDSAVNDLKAATLTIKSPDSCNTTTAYYYTPYVSHVVTARAIVNTTNVPGVPMKQFQKTVGVSTTIPKQLVVGPACNMLDTPTADTVTVVVSNYTGRPNKLIIRLLDSNKIELFANTGYPGNGTYKIPVPNSVYPFQAMTIKAFDYNCYNGDSCIQSTSTVSANRSVYYAATPPHVPEASCVAGQSVLLSFGPDSCEVVGIKNLSTTVITGLHLYPNPATSSATLSFYANGDGAGNIAVRDMLGKLIHSRSISYKKGINNSVLDIAAYSKGVYFVTLAVNNDAQRHNLKLLIE